MNAFQRARVLAHQKLRAFIADEQTPRTWQPEKTLVIIDMQSGFMDEDEYDIVPAICRLIRHAKHNEWPIIVVEFSDNGDTNSDILAAIYNYPHFVTVMKGQCDGGRDVIECIENHPAWSLNILICGIYGPECVANTVCGLFEASDLVEVDVVTDAICPDYISCTEEKSDGMSQEKEVETEDVIGCNSPVSS